MEDIYVSFACFLPVQTIFCVLYLLINLKYEEERLDVFIILLIISRVINEDVINENSEIRSGFFPFFSCSHVIMNIENYLHNDSRTRKRCNVKLLNTKKSFPTK